MNGIARLDVEAIGSWLIEAIAAHRDAGVTAIVPVGHGAGVAALAPDGNRMRLAFPPLDYEQPIPDPVMTAYRTERDPFTLTGSPALPNGLNIGSQLYWLDRLHPDVMRDAVLLPWAQYWAWFLSGTAATEVTSLGCHSDLWEPEGARFSPLAQHMGWASRFAPMARAGDAIGMLRPEIAARTGLSASIRVLAGLHDSNAALLAARGFAEIGGQEATVLSTGTWFIAMRLPREPVGIASLAQGRDCLVNADVEGRPLPSARFMGGREIETIVETDARRVDIASDQPALLAAVPDLMAAGAMLLPTLAPGCGPFPDAQARWIAPPEDWCARRAAACLYAALVADQALDLIGARDRLLIEGRFARAEVLVRALATLRPGTAVFTADADNDVSFGALRLVHSGLKPRGALVRVRPLEIDLAGYRARWHAGLGNRA